MRNRVSYDDVPGAWGRSRPRRDWGDVLVRACLAVSVACSLVASVGCVVLLVLSAIAG